MEATDLEGKEKEVIEAISILNKTVSQMSISLEWAEKAAASNWFQEAHSDLERVSAEVKLFQRSRYAEQVEAVFHRAMERGEFSFKETPDNILESTTFHFNMENTRVKNSVPKLIISVTNLDEDVPF